MRRIGRKNALDLGIFSFFFCGDAEDPNFDIVEFLNTSIRPKFHLETKREFNIYLLLWGSTKEALTLVLGHVPYTNLENLENHRSENRKIGCERQEEREIAKRRNQKKARKPKQ